MLRVRGRAGSQGRKRGQGRGQGREREQGRGRGRRGIFGWAGFLAWPVAVGLVVLGSPTATAGGPTSVLVVSPESAESAALYNSMKQYRELERLLGPPGAGTREEPPGLSVGSGRQINVTWMAHDVSPWRVDRVYPDTPGSREVWIHTATAVPQSMNGHWHRAKQPRAIRALLVELGVMGTRSGEGAGVTYPAPWEYAEEAAQGSAPTEQPRAAATAATRDGTDWWWAIPGLVAGAVLALGLRPVVVRLAAGRLATARHRPGRWGRPWGRPGEREAGPRQELIDS